MIYLSSHEKLDLLKFISNFKTPLFRSLFKFDQNLAYYHSHLNEILHNGFFKTQYSKHYVYSLKSSIEQELKNAI